MCDGTVAVGATCDLTCANFGNDVRTDDDGCFQCAEGTYRVSNACADCRGARHCINATAHTLCDDGALIVAGRCRPTTVQDALVIANNHVVACAEKLHPSGDACAQCSSSCASCMDGSSCLICADGTSLAPDGSCVYLANTTIQAHNGAVECDDTFFAADTRCVACSSVFGAGCVSCSAHECLACAGDVVLDGGVCRKGWGCASGNGTACERCEDRWVPFNATDCFPKGNCLVYADGRCVQCVAALVPDLEGVCDGVPECTARNDGICLRCTDGMYADEGGVCRRLSPTQLTRRVQRVGVRDVRVQRDVLHVV